MKKELLKRIFIVTACLLGALSVGSGVALIILMSRLPNVNVLEDYSPPTATEIYTANSQLLTRISSQGRYDPITMEQVPQYVREAVVIAEDKRFWQHQGVDPLSMLRAIFRNYKNIKQAKGTSTITQQLVKNLFLTSERNMGRKVAEALLAVQVERKYPKEKILEMYLNHIFWGHNVYGIEAAARIYFAKPALQLNLAEAAMLAGIIRSPEGLSPYNNPEGAQVVQKIVLEQMEKEKKITPEERKQAEQTPIRLTTLRHSYPYPYFLDYVMHSLRQEFGDLPARQGGWKIYTTVNPGAQQYAEKLLKTHTRWLHARKAQQAALISIDPHTGYIQAMVGGLDYNESQFNRAFQAMRQVGSTFKPFVYLAAFRKGLALNETLEDSPVRFGGWSPHNWDHRFRGSVTLQQALANSINVPTVKLANRVGMSEVIEVARRTGVQSPIPSDLTSALGASEMTLLELTTAYGVFAAEGAYNRPTAIIKVENPEGFTVKRYFPQPVQWLKAEPVRKINLALQSVITAGTGRAAAIGRPAAGKTGTTSKNYDAWFVGYTPQLVTGVWVGNDTPSPLAGGGSSLAAPLWRQFMATVMRGYPIKGFATPAVQEIPTPSPSETEEASPTPSPEESAIIEIPVSPTPAPTETPIPTDTPLQMATPTSTEEFQEVPTEP